MGQLCAAGCGHAFSEDDIAYEQPRKIITTRGKRISIRTVTVLVCADCA